MFRGILGASGVGIGCRCERGLPGRYVRHRRRFSVDVSSGQVRSLRSLAILMRIWVDGALAWAFPELESVACPASVVTRPSSLVYCSLALRGSGLYKAGSCPSVGRLCCKPCGVEFVSWCGVVFISWCPLGVVRHRRRFLVDVSSGQVRSLRSLAILMRIWVDGVLAWAFPE